MRPLDAADVLALWERGRTRHALDRSALLTAWARPELPADAIADLPLGEITESVLRLRAASFGARIRAHVDCGRCGQRLELNLAISDLLQPVPARPVELAGWRVRPACLRDLASVVHERDAGCAARALLARCMPGAPADEAATWPDATVREIEDALEAADPNADLAFEVHCEACGHCGTAQLDAGALLWDEIDAWARALLGEVHVLASAYGWTEREILGLTPARRAAYLAMAGA
jgi:hypothetical protein